MINKVKISPEVLKWARESLHLPPEMVLEHFEQKSKKKFALDGTILAKIESGSGEEIAFTLLQELSSLYKRPLAVFFLNKPPTEPVLPNDRRTINSDVHKVISPAAVLAIRRARYVQEVFRELSKELEVSLKFPFKKFSLSDDPIEMGTKFRDTLEFSFDVQRKARDARALFDAVRVRLEKVNVFTIKSSFPLEDARAFSLVDQTPQLILINNKDGGYFGYAPKTFSLLHEFAHILLRESAICNDFTNSHQQIEKFCNSFAASFLVPDKFFWEVLGIGREEFDMASLEKYLKPLQAAFKVSQEVLLRKCLTLRLVTDDFYNKKVQQWNDEFEKSKKEKEDKGIKQFIPSIPRSKIAISNNGRRFVELVLHARSEGKITVDSAADYLGVSLKTLPDVEKLSVKPRSYA